MGSSQPANASLPGITSSKEVGLVPPESGPLQKEDSKILTFQPVHHLQKFWQLSQREVHVKGKVFRGPKTSEWGIPLPFRDTEETFQRPNPFSGLPVRGAGHCG